jgi:hypothetical protein
MTELCDLGFKYGTDKCPQYSHSYTRIYYDMFKDKRNEIKKVFEFGVGIPESMRNIPNYKPGASLYMWREFFPNAMIYGADISPDAIFKDDRIETFLCDEMDEKAVTELIKKIGGDIDFFIDDAAHYMDNQEFLCRVAMPLLKKDVVYSIEDVRNSRRMVWRLKRRGYRCEIPEFQSMKYRDGMIIVHNKI